MSEYFITTSVEDSVPEGLKILFPKFASKLIKSSIALYLYL